MTVEQMEQARAWLERDRVLHANMLEVLRRGSADALVAEEGGVLLHDTGCGAWMLAAEPEAAPAFLDRVPAGCGLFVGHDMAYFELAQARLDSIAMGLVSGKGRCVGVPQLIPGRYIKIEYWGEVGYLRANAVKQAWGKDVG